MNPIRIFPLEALAKTEGVTVQVIYETLRAHKHETGTLWRGYTLLKIGPKRRGTWLAVPKKDAGKIQIISPDDLSHGQQGQEGGQNESH